MHPVFRSDGLEEGGCVDGCCLIVVPPCIPVGGIDWKGNLFVNDDATVFTPPNVVCPLEGVCFDAEVGDEGCIVVLESNSSRGVSGVGGRWS